MSERREDNRRRLPRPGGRRADDDPPEWVTISSYADRFGVNRTTVYKWLGEGLLETYRVGALVRVRNVPPDEHRRASPVDGC